MHIAAFCNPFREVIPIPAHLWGSRQRLALGNQPLKPPGDG
jgi:hypothetical protein